MEPGLSDGSMFRAGAASTGDLRCVGRAVRDGEGSSLWGNERGAVGMTLRFAALAVLL